MQNAINFIYSCILKLLAIGDIFSFPFKYLVWTQRYQHINLGYTISILFYNTCNLAFSKYTYIFRNIKVTNNIKTGLQNCSLSKNKTQNFSTERCY